ncbi:FAD/NAD(P)-binding domain-containing protein [Hypoxylon trugodes]|uniref:FAD/NAD(P)-binding domain-containing protein n=1 Tax=Hypoxylon trugodes TaxID=326681 RepID=UPI00219CF052|nr:FAD/NAD(P)-binding domain-containing protein [Hypoxylon trugodes]KAI1390506.1 FAD/NAD(P)-binding domain-containing protein [Hypoxylon trugodes]
MAAAEKPFRAIIVGGGLVGLMAAHIFTKAGIDFVILEQHEDLMPELGSLLSVWPPTFRILDQLGLLDEAWPVLEEVGVGCTKSADDDSTFYEVPMNQKFKENHGHGLRITHRPRFIEVLYRQLPDSAKDRIRLKKRVVSIQVFDDSVSVECDDGTTVRGSIIVGVDGVHSRVRQCMQAMANGKPPPDKSERPGNPYVTTYRMLFANSPILPGLKNNTDYQCASARVATQVVVGSSQAWVGVYEALDEPITGRVKYTDEDKKKTLEKWGHLYMAPGWRVRDVFASNVDGIGMINLEEGRVDKWSYKRVVLVSDAVRKLSPLGGLGFNSGTLDVVVLVNKLRRLLQTTASPSTETLEALFVDYQKDRLKDENPIHELSSDRTRAIAWLSFKDKIMTKYVVPWSPLNWYAFKYVFAPLISRLPVLYWLEENALPKKIRVSYIHHPTPSGQRSVSKSHGSSILSISVIGLVLAAISAIGFQYSRRL